MSLSSEDVAANAVDVGDIDIIDPTVDDIDAAALVFAVAFAAGVAVVGGGVAAAVAAAAAAAAAAIAVVAADAVDASEDVA